MMPLTMARPGETVTIRKITGDVTVVSQLAGNLILQVKDSRVALDKTMANRIMI